MHIGLFQGLPRRSTIRRCLLVPMVPLAGLLLAGCAGAPDVVLINTAGSNAIDANAAPANPATAGAAPVAVPPVLPAPQCRQQPIAYSISAAAEGQAADDQQEQGVAGMLASALDGSGCFVEGGPVRLPAPPLQLSGDSDAAAAMPALQPDRPQLLIQTAIRSFQQPCKGGSLIVLADNQACITIELHLSDAETGQLARATLVAGDSKVPAAPLRYAGGPLPAVLGASAGTPMEQAIRNVVERAAATIVYWYLIEQP
jgi:curli biogenesis system outer membrane secretion channel CsgG